MLVLCFSKLSHHAEDGNRHAEALMFYVGLKYVKWIKRFSLSYGECNPLSTERYQKLIHRKNSRFLIRVLCTLKSKKKPESDAVILRNHVMFGFYCSVVVLRECKKMLIHIFGSLKQFSAVCI